MFWLFVVNLACLPSAASGCGLFEIFKRCKTCDPTCLNQSPSCLTQQTCSPGCICIKGYVRQSPPFYGCIPLAACNSSMFVDKRCGQFEEYRDSKGCVLTCATRNSIQRCPDVPGCNCIPGYVMNDFGRCMPVALCNDLPSPDVKSATSCIINPAFRITATEACCRAADCCYDTCGKCRRDPLCLKVNGFTVIQPVPQTVDAVTCGQNEQYNSCGSPCPPSCKSPNPVCARRCAAGCFCNPGYIHDLHGNCIRPEQCPANRLCGPNMVYLECGTACPPSCSVPNPKICTLQCIAGCFCITGFLVDADGSCVSRDKCNKPCPANEQWVECVSSSCRPSCTNPNPQVCTADCFRGCVCSAGFFREGKGTDRHGGSCIHANQCIVKGDCHKKAFEQSFNQRVVGAFVAKCEDSGEFYPLQCHGSTGYCWCVERKTGAEIVGTRRGPGEGVPNNCFRLQETIKQVSSAVIDCTRTADRFPKYCDSMKRTVRPTEFCNWTSKVNSLRDICAKTCCDV